VPIPATWSSQLLSILRIVTGLGFLQHGVSKFFGVPPFPMPLNPLLTTAGVLELVGGTLIVLGLFTRPVAFILSGMSAAAYFIAHLPQGFFPAANGGSIASSSCISRLPAAVSGALTLLATEPERRRAGPAERAVPA